MQGAQARQFQRLGQGGQRSPLEAERLGAHFALATGLHPALAAAGDARVVSVSSSQHRLSPVVFDDIHYESRPYEPNAAYGQSKTANALFAVEAAGRWADDGIAVNAVMPGIIRTNLMRHADPDDLARAGERVITDTPT